MSYRFRTDLAREMRGEYMKEYSKEHSGEPDGVKYEVKQVSGFEVQTVEITDERGEKILEKPVGKYITLDTGRLWTTDFFRFKKAADELSRIISSFFDASSAVLVVGLGNRYITPDAIGPLTVHNVIATRHIMDHDGSVYDTSGLGNVCAMVPGVLSETGIEASEQIRGVVQRIKPTCVIVIDALAAKNTDTLACTVQITDTGISPGSGVGNDRGELSQKTLGVPTLAIGVPTVVDTSTLVWNTLEEYAPDARSAYDALKESLQTCYVTVKDADEAVNEMARLIGFSINRSFHNILSYEEMMYM